MDETRHDELLSDMSPTTRFSNRAADYVRYRPSYPAAAIDAVLSPWKDARAIVAADVGAGTGISSRLLAERGVRVIALEPNAEMRAAAVPHRLVSWREGAAESTGLESGSVDLVMCAQAFHWFRAVESLAEFHRILRAGGWLALMWNSRDDRDELTRGYKEAIHAVNGEHPAERHVLDRAVISAAGLFAAASYETFESEQELDRPGLIGRAASASYVPKEGAGFAALRASLDALFERHRDTRGMVKLRYVTKVYRAERR